MSCAVDHEQLLQGDPKFIRTTCPRTVSPSQSSASRPPLNLESYQSSDFSIGSVIGSGSFATVHAATDCHTRRNLAIKKPRPPSDFGLPLTSISGNYGDVLAAMRRDLLHAARLAPHPNVVTVLGSADHGRLIIMERAATDLQALIGFCAPPRRRLPLSLVAAWTHDLLAAIDHLHRSCLAHMDIKSANVLLFADCTAKLCDFGLAQAMPPADAGGSGGRIPVDREVVTLWSRPPELLLGAATHTAAVDEWGAGCVAMEMLLGAAPFQGDPRCACTCDRAAGHFNFNSDQLMRVLAAVGTPEDEGVLRRAPCWPHVAAWPVFPGRLPATIRKAVTADRLAPLHAFPSTDPAAPTDAGRRPPAPAPAEEAAAAEWLELAGGLLTVDPRRRLSARAALGLPALRAAEGAARGGLDLRALARLPSVSEDFLPAPEFDACRAAAHPAAAGSREASEAG